MGGLKLTAGSPVAASSSLRTASRPFTVKNSSSARQSKRSGTWATSPSPALPFAQVADVGGIISQAGIKAAFHSMPAFREVLRDMKTGRMKLQDAQEIDSAFAAGTDWLRGSTHLTADDFGNITSSESRWGVAEEPGSPP